MWFWRPILGEGGGTIDVATLTNDEVHEMNAAMDIMKENGKREADKARRKRKK